MPIMIHELPNGKFRDATSEEILLAHKIQAARIRLEAEQRKISSALDDLKDNCTHPAQFDQAGEPCDMRTCVACGRTSLL